MLVKNARSAIAFVTPAMIEPISRYGALGANRYVSGRSSISSALPRSSATVEPVSMRRPQKW